MHRESISVDTVDEAHMRLTASFVKDSVNRYGARTFLRFLDEETATALYWAMQI